MNALRTPKAAISRHIAIAALALMVGSGSCLAQSQTQAQTQPQPQAPAAPATTTDAAPSNQAAPPTISSGSAAAVTSTPGMTPEKFDDWYYHCAGTNADLSCEVAQVAQVVKDGKTVNVLTLAIAPSPAAAGKDSRKPKPGMMLTTLVPLNIFLPTGLNLKADGKSLVKLVYRNCNQSGCWSQQEVDSSVIDAMAKGSVGEGQLRLMRAGHQHPLFPERPEGGSQRTPESER